MRGVNILGGNNKTMIEERKDKNLKDKQIVISDNQDNEKDETRYIYCGPNLINKGIMQNTIFIGYPEHLKDVIKLCPAIKGLIVPIRELNNVNENINKKGTYENSLYGEILKFINGVK